MLGRHDISVELLDENDIQDLMEKKLFKDVYKENQSRFEDYGGIALANEFWSLVRDKKPTKFKSTILAKKAARSLKAKLGGDPSLSEAPDSDVNGYLTSIIKKGLINESQREDYLNKISQMVIQDGDER